MAERSPWSFMNVKFKVHQFDSYSELWGNTLMCKQMQKMLTSDFYAFREAFRRLR